MGKISVVITSYNHGKYLKGAIESVLQQTLLPLEVIICDDVSMDDSRKLIREYEQRYPGFLKVIFHENNIGISKNRNSGLTVAKGDYITWLDGDDLYTPTKLEYELAKMKQSPQVSWVYSQVMHINKDGKELGLRYPKGYEGSIFTDVILLLGQAPRNMLVQRDVLREVGFFNESMGLFEDFNLVLELSKNYRCSYNSAVGYKYRLGLATSGQNVDVGKYVYNLNLLQNNLKELISDYPVKKQSELEKRFLNGKYWILFSRCISSRKYFSAALYFFLHKVFALFVKTDKEI
jgi:glycosyltransferase involved in cell wall biosynthesis